MNHGNSHQRSRFIQKHRRENRLHNAEHCQPDRRSDDIEGKMNQRRPLGVLVRSDRGDQRRNASADILSHDDRNCRAVGNRSGGSQRLQNTDGRRTGLDDCGQNRADRHAEKRVGEQQEEFAESGNILQPRHRARHGLHAEHQRCKAEQDHARVLLLVLLAEHIQHNARKREDRSKRGRFQQLNPNAAAVNARKAQNPRRNGRSDVRAHNHIDGLPQAHQPRVDEADHHDRGCRGTLNDCRYPEPRQKPPHFAARQFSEHAFQTAPRAALQSLSHQAHAEQEQAKPPEHG